jgi:DNA (cytosine-5)-methyltransferase 1
LKVSSFFSGIGGFDLGLERAGMEVVFQCEINSFRKKVLKKHWPDIPLFSDINLIEPSEIPDSELWCGGFPCQDLSLANQGKRKGLKGERSGLFFKFSELIQTKKPKWLIIENVPGLLNSNSGQDFKVLIRTLDELGYCLAWRIFDAKYFGTPQRRRRVFIVGSYGNRSSSEVLFKYCGVEFATRAGLGKEEANGALSGKGNKEAVVYSIQHASIGRKHTAGPQAKGYRSDGETYTFDSRGGADALCATNDSFRIRKTSRISKELDGHKYRALGDAVNVSVIKWIGERIILSEKNKL